MRILSNIVRFIRKIHRFLLPRQDDIGWIPYLWLVYLSAFLIQWYLAETTPWEHVASGLGIAAFLYLYFRGYWVSGRSSLWIIAGITALAVLLLPINNGSITFFIYAASFCGRVGRPRQGLGAMAGVVAAMLVETLFLPVPRMVLTFGLIFTVIVALINIYYQEVARKNAQLKLTQEEIKHLAAMTERERIARDLHDLLGHTLSLIAIKSELAAKLLVRDSNRAVQEIRDVEKISRQALKQVREAVLGYRTAGLAGELANAHLAFEAMNIRFQYQLPRVRLPAEGEAVLAMVVREAATNIIRHSRADGCRINIKIEKTELVMTIADNGRGGEVREGGGLTGMRERLREIGGELAIASGKGVTLTVRLPHEGDLFEPRKPSVETSPPRLEEAET